MEYNYNLNTLLNFSNLASGPFCIGEDNLRDVSSNLLSCDLYFNGLNYFGLGEVLDSEKQLSEIPGNHTNLDVGSISDFFKNESYASDYFSEDGLITSLQQNDDDIFDDVDINSPIFDYNEDVFSSSDSDSLSPTHSSTISNNDIPFSSLSTVDTDETIIEKQDACDGLLFDFVVDPLDSTGYSSLGSPDKGFSADDMSGNAKATFLEFSDEKSDVGFERQMIQHDIMPTTEINLLSPKSVDSGISMASSCESSIFDEVSIDLVDLLSMSNSSPVKTWKHSADTQAQPDLLSGKQMMDIACPNSVDSSISASSDETSCNYDDIALNQSILTTLLKKTAIQNPGTGLEDHVLADESDSSEENYRYMPYKGKRKTPEQKLRKKTQNRSAASRYRSKKKDEFNNIFAEASKLDEKNKELKGKVEGLSSEINYLKSLMLDVINARLSKKPNVSVSLSGLLQSVQ